MQDEINEKVVALSVKGAKLTAEMLQKAIKAMLAQAKKNDSVSVDEAFSQLKSKI